MYLQDGSYENPWLVGAVSENPGKNIEDTFDNEWALCSTDVLLKLLEEGHQLQLPEVYLDDESVRSMYTEEDLVYADAQNEDLDIVAIEYIGEDEVQCIEIEDEEHLYLTDLFISTHNTSNIVFLKSTDDSMLDTLEKMSGKTHRVYRDTKNITMDSTRIFFRNEDKLSYTMSVKEEPVIKYNDMAFIEERNSIVFRAGNSPIWNRRELVLPMSWRLFQNKIVHPGHDYTLQTIPTLSTAIDFDVRRNQPNFEAMVDKRIMQAIYAPEAIEAYKVAYGIVDDYAIERLDPDVYSDAIMQIINRRIADDNGLAPGEYSESVASTKLVIPKSEDNVEQARETKKYKMDYDKANEKRYAHGKLAWTDLVEYDDEGRKTKVNHSFDTELIHIFIDNIQLFEQDAVHFRVVDGCLKDANGAMMYIKRNPKSVADAVKVEEMTQDGTARVYAEDQRDVTASEIYSGTVTDGFYNYLTNLESWTHLAGGAIEDGLYRMIKENEE